MASIRKRKWFTPTQRKSIDPVARQLAGPAWDIKKTQDGGLSRQKRGEFIDAAAKSLGIKPEERWLVDYKDSAGVRRLKGKGFSTKRKAEEWSTNALHEVQQGIHTPSSISKTVGDAWQEWIDDCEASGLEKSTVRQRRQHLNHHVKPFIGSTKLSDLTTPMVYDFERKLRDDAKNPRSLAMRRKVLTNLKTMLSFAQRKGLVAQNVASAIRLKSDDRNTSKGPLRAGIDFPTRAELNVIIDAAMGRWRPLVVTAIFTGMRASELRGLPWRDVDLDAGIVHVRQRADAWNNIGPPKSKAGKRDIPLAPIVINALKKWKEEYPKGELDLVFPNGAGNVESHSNLYDRFWQPLQIGLGLTAEAIDEEGKPVLDDDGNPVVTHRYGFHTLRHAAASLFIQHLKWSPKRIQTVMGHSSVRMTYDLYGHLFDDIEKDRADMATIEAAIRAA